MHKSLFKHSVLGGNFQAGLLFLLMFIFFSSGVIATELSRNLHTYWFLRAMKPIFNFVAKTPFYGAQTTLYCALDDAIECESGMYYSDCVQKSPSAAALNKEDQKKLWTISEEMVGIKSN